jgi:hypothetical protein
LLLRTFFPTAQWLVLPENAQFLDASPGHGPFPEKVFALIAPSLPFQQPANNLLYQNLSNFTSIYLSNHSTLPLTFRPY